MDPAASPMRRLHEWIERHPAWGVRVYRTRSGLRYLVTHAPYSPEDPNIKAAMEFLGADPQYRNLCKAQKSFRARLTPKPWRVGLTAPHLEFPRTTQDKERAAAEWVTGMTERPRTLRLAGSSSRLGTRRFTAMSEGSSNSTIQ
jgi:hypothetical protein